MRRVHRILHPALSGASAPEERPSLAAACRTDRQRLGVLLQGAALLAHLDRAAWHLAHGWGGAWLDGRVLRVEGAASGRAIELPQDLLIDLLGRVFARSSGDAARIAGRGEARRAARALQQRWRQPLAPLSPDRAVSQLLDEAPFLWRPQAAAARSALAAVLIDDSGRRTAWVAGPGRLRRRALARASDLDELTRLLASPRARALAAEGISPDAGAGERRAVCDPEALAAAGRWRAALAGWEETPPGDDSGRLARAGAWFSLGRFERALSVLDELTDAGAAASTLRVSCLFYLGRLAAARRAVARAAALRPSGATAIELAAVAVRVAANAGDPEGVRCWARRALVAAQVIDEEGLAEAGSDGRAAEARGTATATPGDELAMRARLVAAQAAWDVADTEALDEHLAALAECATPSLAWAISQVRALRAGDRGEPQTAVTELTGALSTHRRRLRRFEAAGLWNDLGVARGGADDLAGAERAFLHALRLYRECDGPRHTTLGLVNLAEVRLRRGRLRGVSEILELTSAANRAAGNRRGEVSDLLSWARFELLQGRFAAGLELVERAVRQAVRHGLDGQLDEARVLAARALGWLGRAADAAGALDAASPAALAYLEPEERPAVLALAGRRDEALAAARESPAAGEAWRATLSGRPVSQAAWRALAALEAPRLARAVFDLERLVPGIAPTALRRRAVAALRRLGAAEPAAELEVRDEGPWRAVSEFLSRAEAGAADGLARLFDAAGYPAARLWWESSDDVRVLVPGEGDPDARCEELSAPAAGGRLILRAPVLASPLEALFHLARRELASRLREPGPTRASESGDGARNVARPERAAERSGIVGESPGLVAAVTRIERLAAGDLAILVRGESGTGKELVARHLHRASRRRDRPLVTVNCAALAESLILSDLFGHVRGAFTGADRDRAGVFETADGGTVFLDEIGDLPPSAQGLLLRTLQEGEVRRVGESLPRRVDVRVVAATHRDLAEMVAVGTFREDLYYRLRGAAVELPPLRERGDDVLRLAAHLLATTPSPNGGDAVPRQISREAAARLRSHPWPGNVRELANVMAVAALLAAGDGGVIRPEHLELPGPADGAGSAPPAGGYHRQVEELRRGLVEEALRESGGVQAAAARRLGLSRQAMSYLVKQLGVELGR